MNLNIDAVLTCIVQYQNAVMEENEARDAYEGWSFDYHGDSYIRATEKAREFAQKVLDDYITLRVKQEIEKLTGDK